MLGFHTVSVINVTSPYLREREKKQTDKSNKNKSVYDVSTRLQSDELAFKRGGRRASFAWHGIAVIPWQVGASSPPSDVMMEQSQVRWAILLSCVPLKVRRLQSPSLLWAAAGPDCRSLKLYWVSAKALTLPISQHASSQLSLPSGLIPSPERINI